ncbi:MAG: hypothetical protein OEZ43_21025 [Gammaproteobacteria bacterium]|nr:hypothetical protein [Gammaproteobacteria bacterium]
MVATANVTVNLNDQTGAKSASAILYVQLDKSDISSTDGFISRALQSFSTDINGQVTMALWPNDQGTQGSLYRVQAYKSTGELLFSGTFSAPTVGGDLFALLTLDDGTGLQPFPQPNYARAKNLMIELAEMTKTEDALDEYENYTAKGARINRWITRVLQDMKIVKPRLWFLENFTTSYLEAGADVIDLQGDIDKVIGVYGPKKLEQISLQKLISMRQEAKAGNQLLGGEPKVYATEAGKRVHLFPAPEKEYSFGLHYTRPLVIEIIPDEFELVVYYGVIGLFAGSFDRDKLVYEPREYRGLYQDRLNNALVQNLDVLRIISDWRMARGTTSVNAVSSTGGAMRKTVPASLSGVGYESVYVMQVM